MAAIVFHPAIDDARFRRFSTAAAPLEVVAAESAAEAIAMVSEARGFVGKITPPILAAASRLEWVQTATASLEHYMFPALIEHPCTLTNVSGIFGDVISEHVLGYVLTFTRNLHRYRDQQQTRVYRPCGADELVPDFVGGPAHVTPVDKAHRRLSETRILIVGYGGIGRVIGKALSHFAAHVDAVDPIADTCDQPAGGQLFRPERLSSVIGDYDFVIVAAPHTPNTEGLFDESLLRRMRSDAVLINVGRGAIVRLADLERVLTEGVIGGAALDVFEEEPLPPTSTLWDHPNVLVTPHVAACCTAIPERHAEVISSNLSRFASGQPLRNAVRKAEWF